MWGSVPGFFWFGWPCFALKNQLSSPDEAKEKCLYGLSIVLLNYSNKVTFRSHSFCFYSFSSWLCSCACLHGTVVWMEVGRGCKGCQGGT